LTVARLVARKGLETALEALALPPCSRLRLDVVGEGPLAQDLHQQAQRLGLNGRLAFRGALQDEALQAAYRDADFFVLPSLTESFSMSLLEAMASALPVVASDVGGIPELVHDRKNGILVPPADPQKLAAALAAMAASAELRNACSAANRRRIEERFTWQRVTREYLDQCYRRPSGAALADRRASSPV
jgi:glycosyltransferase involved in cell wall biosynthesis